MTTFALDEVAILDPKTGDLVGHCGGPDPDGRCPEVAEGEVVPCAGERVVSDCATHVTSWRLHVPVGATRCPVAWLPDVDEPIFGD